MVRFMLASRAGSGGGIPASTAGLRTGAATGGSEGAARGAAGLVTMSEGAVTRGAAGAGITGITFPATDMAAMLSARAAGSGGGMPASTEGSRAGAGGEAARSCSEHFISVEQSQCCKLYDAKVS